MSHLIKASPLATCILIALFAAPVYAHNGVDHATDAEADAHVKASVTTPLRPLDALKAKARTVTENIPGVQVEMRTGASSTSERGGLRSLFLMHGGVIKNRFRLAIAHMNNLLERIESRLEKLAAEGIDTAAVVTLHADAEVAIDKAEADAKAVADFLATANDASDRAAFKAELEAKLRTAHQSIKTAHDAVKKTVRALVALAKENKPQGDANASVEATTTVEVDVQ